MGGEWAPVWRDTWREIWAPLSRHSDAPNDLFIELFREWARGLAKGLTPEQLADAVATPEQARRSLRQARPVDTIGETALISFFERAYLVTEDMGGDLLSNRYFILVEKFLGKFSLRYDLRRPFTLHPTLSGVFNAMMRDLKMVTNQDEDLRPIFYDFEESMRDLTTDKSARLIKTCIQKQMNLLEALGQKSPGVTGNTLGRICEQVGTWPHDSVRDAVKALYKFACDYPGIRHAGNPGSRTREIEMKDMVAMSVLLAGVAPYLSHGLDSDLIYQR